MDPLQPKITDCQGEVLSMIVDYYLAHKRAPTLREVGKATGIGSTNGVNDHLKALEKKGYISRDPFLSRGFAPVGISVTYTSPSADFIHASETVPAPAAYVDHPVMQSPEPALPRLL